jgi:hypothetical protein
MKVLLFLPFALIASSCLYPEPYAPPRSPYRQGGPAYPYGPRGPQMPPDSGDYGGETGRYEQLSGERPSSPQGESRPPAPRIDDDFDPTPDAPAPQPQPQPKKEYPTAETTGTPGRVISPYAPYNVIDVEGFKSGALAKDPSNGKIFRVP